MNYTNGVKPRADGKGDGWANAHREQLGPDYHCQDIDGYFGFCAWGANSGDRLFMEHVPDGFKNANNLIREYAVVALFDRKSTTSAARCDRNIKSTSFYLWLCRNLSMAQPFPVRFFWVIGKDNPPWMMQELSIETGEEKEDMITLDKPDWRSIWDTIGLTDLRNSLKKWLREDIVYPF